MDPTTGFVDENGDPINPRKAGTGERGGGGGGYRPPGGPTIGPGGGFGGGFGGGGYFGAGAGMPGGDFFGVNTIRPRKRYVQGPNGPIAVSSSPMGTDTVPAMLTPGEFVVNREAAQMPGAQGALEALNGAGLAKRFSEGGMVEEHGGGDDRKELLMKLLRLLLDDGDGPEGYAWGGMVQPRQPGMALRAPRMPQDRFGGGGQSVGLGGKQMAAPAGFNPVQRLGTAWQRAGGGTAGQGGGAPAGSGGASQWQDPWGPELFTPGSQNPGDEWMARISQMLRDAGQFGAFSPEGSKGLMDLVRGDAMSNADALRRRAELQADVSGLDPGQRAAYKMQTDLNTQGDVAKTLNNATMQQLLGQQQFQQNMLGKFSDANMQAWLARLASWMKGG